MIAKSAKQFILINKPLVGVITLSVILRVVAALFLGNQVTPMPGVFDQISYHTLALRLLDGHGFSFGEVWWPATPANEPTAHWSYLYTLYLAAVYFLFGPNPLIARLIQAVAVGVLMPWLLYRIARRFYWPPKATRLSSNWIGLIAAAVSAVYAYFVYYSVALVTEGFYVIAFLWAMDLALQISQSERSKSNHWLWLGVALTTAVLLRQLFLLFIPFLLLWLWWTARPRLAQLALPLVILIVAIIPWTVRNYLAFDQFVLLNTNAGYAFYWGNHPVHGASFKPLLVSEMGENYRDTLPPDLMTLGLNEAALESELMRLGIQFVVTDPKRYILLSISRIPHYFVFWPSAESGLISNISRVASFGLFLPFMLYGLFLAGRQRVSGLGERVASPFFLLFLFMLVYTGIHVLTWTLIRYRLPVDAVLLLFAGLALTDLAERAGILKKNPSGRKLPDYTAAQLTD
jgi:4-amino-4-deoxy-L-arabinose transferase-like glycosyltransferase